jgi:hypothetical protein
MFTLFNLVYYYHHHLVYGPHVPRGNCRIFQYSSPRSTANIVNYCIRLMNAFCLPSIAICPEHVTSILQIIQTEMIK